MTRRGRPRRETPSFEELGREWVFNFSLPARPRAGTLSRCPDAWGRPRFVCRYQDCLGMG